MGALPRTPAAEADAEAKAAAAAAAMAAAKVYERVRCIVAAFAACCHRQLLDISISCCFFGAAAVAVAVGSIWRVAPKSALQKHELPHSNKTHTHTHTERNKQKHTQTHTQNWHESAKRAKRITAPAAPSA